MKPAYELPASRADEGVDGSFVRGTACFERKALPPSSMCFECSARQTILPGASWVWTSSPMHKRQHIGTWSAHAQRSTIMFHVKPGVGCAHRPHQHVSATSTGYAPYSHSLSHRVPLRDAGGVRCSGRIRSTQRFDETGRTAATRRRESGRFQTSRTRIGSHRQHGAMPPARSTQSHVGLALAPATDYRYCVHLFHVKPAVGCGLIRFLRRRASASKQERGPMPTETMAPMRVRPGSA